MALSNYTIEDHTFPKSFDLMPCPMKLNKIKLLKHKLNLLYKSKLKNQPQELFKRKTAEADSLPHYSEVKKLIDAIVKDAVVVLGRLEEILAPDVEINFGTDKVCSPHQKLVSY